MLTFIVMMSIGLWSNPWHNPDPVKGTYFTIQSKAADFPYILGEITDPPKQLYVVSDNWQDLSGRSCVAIVGSRKMSPYGKEVTASLSRELARAGVVIVSGLALGVDAAAHRGALDADGLTIGVLAGGLDRIHPSSHFHLAQQIVNSGGALISEYPEGTPSYPNHFIARNRLVSGLCQAVLVTEAAAKSGTMHTVRFALEQGREVLAVPGAITNPTSFGTNNLIKSGAAIITSAEDIFHVLGMKSSTERLVPQSDHPHEQAILAALRAGEHDGADLLQKTGLGVQAFNQALTMLEIKGCIRAGGNNRWTLA